jgi:hypothetical protein
LVFCKAKRKVEESDRRRMNSPGCSGKPAIRLWRRGLAAKDGTGDDKAMPMRFKKKDIKKGEPNGSPFLLFSTN